MESSAPKRRKTSPTTAVAIDATNKSTTPTESPPSSRTRRSIRPSFASPTKASLARHNPDILSRRQPTTTTSPGGDDAEPRASRPGTPEGDDVEQALSAQLERLSEPDLEEPGEDPDNGSQEAIAASNRRLSAPARRISGNLVKSPARRLGGGLAAKPRRSSIKPSPRPLPPPGPEDEEDILNPFVGRGLHRSPAGVIPEIVQEEPDLPPTPEHPDPVVSTPPSGIHNTPSKRPRRSKSLADKIRSSPSKPPPSKAPPLSKSRTIRRGSPEPFRDPPPKSHSTRASVAKANARGLEAPDPDAEKKKRKAELLEQIAQLEEDFTTVYAENQWIEKEGSKSALVTGREDVLRILRAHVMPPPKTRKSNASAKWLEAALNPIAFLPFGKQSSTLPSLFPEKEADAEDENQPPPISHHPVQMSAKNELPYLQVFTPLSFTSKISMVQEGSSDRPPLQKHVITAKSNNPPDLFTARLEMTTNTNTLAITDLTVPRVEPAAVAELVPFIDSVLRQGSTNSALMKNVSVITWAMGEWYRVAMQRAKFWVDLNSELGSKEAILECVRSMRTRKPGRRRRKQPTADEEENDDDETTTSQGRPSGESKYAPKSEVLSHLGRLSQDLEIPVFSSPDGDRSDLRVEWRIEFDWTGEARSKIGVHVGVPAKWHQGDERKSLAGLPDLFDKMVHGGEDPLTAVKTVVSLLAGEASSS